MAVKPAIRTAVRSLEPACLHTPILPSLDKQSGKDEVSRVSHWLIKYAEFLVRGPRCKRVGIYVP